MSDKKMPFCWKCNSAITTLTKEGGSFEMDGCTECSDIKNFDDAQKLCPLFDHSPKVVIAVIDGEVSIVEKPDNLLVEVRDYVEIDDRDYVEIDDRDYVEIDDNDQNAYHQDKNGDYYRVFSFPATKIKFSANGPSCFTDVEIKYRNFYEHCGQKWNDVWDSRCNDECPVCHKEIEPYRSEDIEQE